MPLVMSDRRVCMKTLCWVIPDATAAAFYSLANSVPPLLIAKYTSLHPQQMLSTCFKSARLKQYRPPLVCAEDHWTLRHWCQLVSLSQMSVPWQWWPLETVQPSCFNAVSRNSRMSQTCHYHDLRSLLTSGISLHPESQPPVLFWQFRVRSHFLKGYAGVSYM